MPSITDEIYDTVYGNGPEPEDYWDWISGPDSFFHPENGHALIISLLGVDTGTYEFEVRDYHYDEAPVILRDTYYFGTHNYEMVVQAILMFLTDGE